MKRIPVKSSDIASVGYDELTLTLEIEFKNGSIYEYYRVPKAVYLALMNADSKGKYFRKYIRGNHMYIYRQVFPEQKWPR